MSRYTGPVHRKSRRYGFSTLESGKEFAKGKQRQTAPGQHGSSKRQKLSDYGIHLYEKQKVKYMYGLTEKQFENSFHKSSKLGGVAGTSFLQFLESRLDNLVFRLGFAETRRQSRQLVNHGHFLIDGKKVDIPSFNVKVGSTITLKEASKKNKQILEAIEKRGSAAWLEYDKAKLEGKYTRHPERSELNKDINDGLIVEYYNK